ADASGLIARNDISRGRGIASQVVVGTCDLDPRVVPLGLRSRNVRPQVIASDAVAAGAIELDARPMKPIDNQSLNRTPTRHNPKTGVVDIAAVQLDDRLTGKARLAGAVNHERFGDDR